MDPYWKRILNSLPITDRWWRTSANAVHSKWSFPEALDPAQYCGEMLICLHVDRLSSCHESGYMFFHVTAVISSPIILSSTGSTYDWNGHLYNSAACLTASTNICSISLRWSSRCFFLTFFPATKSGSWINCHCWFSARKRKNIFLAAPPFVRQSANCASPFTHLKEVWTSSAWLTEMVSS